MGERVFMAPRTEHTAFVFLGQLLNLKGTDASWRNDEEVPAKFQVTKLFCVLYKSIQSWRRRGTMTDNLFAFCISIIRQTYRVFE